MNFDLNNVFTTVNADELRAGDKVIVADQLSVLKQRVQEGKENSAVVLQKINGEDWGRRFGLTISDFALAYLVERKENCTNCVCSCDTPERVNKKTMVCKNYEPKTEKHYRPFKDTDELIKVWDAKIGTPNWGTDGDLTMPHIWVRRKDCDSELLITGYNKPDGEVFICDAIDLTQLFDNFTFLDGSPCGVEE